MKASGKEIGHDPETPYHGILQDHRGSQRGASPHTCATYAESSCRLFDFASQRLKVAPSALCLEQIDAPLVAACLEYLEAARTNTASSRNGRLAAIKSFCRFLEHRHPAAFDQMRRSLALPFKRTVSRLVPYLGREPMQAILDAPDPRTRPGLQDRAMLHIALAAGLRVSELIGLRTDDLTLQPPSIRVRGKGRRERILLLWKVTATALRAWLVVRGQVPVPELFVNAQGQPMTRWGVAFVVRKHVQAASQRCPALLQKRVSLHVLRHICAMVALQATHDIRKVSLWLGHSSPETTDIYTRIDPTEKLEAINTITPPALRKGRFRPPDKLLALLRMGSLMGSESSGNRSSKRAPRIDSP